MQLAGQVQVFADAIICGFQRVCRMGKGIQSAPHNSTLREGWTWIQNENDFVADVEGQSPQLLGARAVLGGEVQRDSQDSRTAFLGMGGTISRVGSSRRGPGLAEQTRVGEDIRWRFDRERYKTKMVDLGPHINLAIQLGKA